MVVKSSKNQPISIGKRVKRARMLSGYNRHEFSKHSNISAPTLRAWEEPPQGRSGLTNKGAKRFTRALNQMGIYCTENWLLNGSGPYPFFIQNELSSNVDNIEVTWGEEESILKDIESFKKNNPDPIVAIITDKSMMPIFDQGDYVGGCEVYQDSIQQLVGRNCIIGLDNNILVRKIANYDNGVFTLLAINQDLSTEYPILTSIKINFAAEIIWHRWRKKNKI